MRARILFGMFAVWIAVSGAATDVQAFGRSAPQPDPAPSASPSPLPSAAPSPVPAPSPAPSAAPSALPVQLGQIVIGGPGCPTAATAVSISPDGRTIRLTTNALLASLAAGATVARADCSVALPVSGLPAGARLVLTEASATGSFSLAAGAAGQASLEAFLAGQTSTPSGLGEGSANSATEGPLAIQVENAAIGDCGADAIVRINASVGATQSPPASDVSVLAFDTLEFEIDVQSCE